MKHVFTFIIVCLFISVTASAQVFWTENFGATCQPRGNQSYTGPNGAWTINNTGTNQTYGNDFYITDRIAYNGIGVCAVGNALSCNTNNNSLHVGGKAIAVLGFPADSSSLWSGAFCGFGFCATTNRRAESPVINCTGKSGITLSFVYYEGGDFNNGDLNGDATLMYYDGSTWSKISDLIKEPAPPNRPCSGTMYGQFQAFSISLPASANNNPNVKIGFNWSNNDVSHAQDPSFAVDSIQLSSGSVAVPPVAKFTASDTSDCTPLCISFTDKSTNSPTSWLWTFTGSTTPSSTMQNPIGICFNYPGTYSVKLKVTNSGGSDSTVMSVTAIASPPVPNVTQHFNTLWSSIDPSYTSYQWYDNSIAVPGATHPWFVITHGGNFGVSVSNESGCSVATGFNVGVKNYSTDNKVSIYPNPASNVLTVTGNWQSTSGVLSLCDILGNKIKEETVKLDDKVVINVKSLSKGIYFLQINSGTTRWTGKFIKN